MSQVPARLVYTDDTATEQVIGAYQPQDPTTGNISTFTIEENAKNYKRVIIEGGPTLQDSMPTAVSEFNGSEPEIRVQVDSNLDGTWEERLRVYPEVEGTTNDRGRYKNKDLWGFKKYYGEDDVSTGTVSTDLTAALDALLPDGYVARYPGDITAPSVSNYSFSGARQQGFRELQRYYNHYILFTTETDGSGNYYVDLQPKGYGGTQFSLTRGTDGYTYNYWKKADSSNVVSKVKVIGKNSNNEKVERVIAAGSSTGVHGSDTDVDVYLGSPEPARRKFRRIHVDYTITESEADSIGENVITPEAIEQGEIEHELNIESTLNQSVGIVDNNRTPDNPIDDVFTVVKQKDFIHQGVTSYSFEFEKEATEEQVDKWTEHDFERASVYPESTQQKTVGPLDIDDSVTDTEEVSEQYDADSQNNHPHGNSNTTSDVGQIDTEGQQTADQLSFSISDGASNTVTANDVSYGGNQYVVDYVLDTNAGYGAEFIIQVRLAESGTILRSFVTKTNNGGNIENIFTDLRNADGEDIEFLVVNKSGSSVSVNIQSIIFVGEAPHDHFVNIAPTDGNTADLTINVNTSDSTAGDTSQLTVSGQTLDDLIDILTTQEDKTDR